MMCLEVVKLSDWEGVVRAWNKSGTLDLISIRGEGGCGAGSNNPSVVAVSFVP